MGIVYGLWCTCHPEKGIRYAGQTSRGWRNRWRQHKHGALKGHPYPSSRWIRKHGPENIRSVVLGQTDDLSELDDLETWWIEYLRGSGQADLNVTDGGGGIRGVRHTEDSKRIFADTMRKNHANPEFEARRLAAFREKMTGAGNHNYGKPVPEDRKRKQSLSVSKLSPDEIREIRLRGEAGERHRSIASDYGVSASTISRVTSRKQFWWITD